MKHIYYLFTIAFLIQFLGFAQANYDNNEPQHPHILPESSYPYWPAYTYLNEKDHTISGWDWSFSKDLKPFDKSIVGLQRHIKKVRKKLGFDIDQRWSTIENKVALKVTYFDNHSGVLELQFSDGNNIKSKSQILTGNKGLKATTFMLPKIQRESFDHYFDFVLKAGENTKKIIVSMVQIVNANL